MPAWLNNKAITTTWSAPETLNQGGDAPSIDTMMLSPILNGIFEFTFDKRHGVALYVLKTTTMSMLIVVAFLLAVVAMRLVVLDQNLDDSAPSSFIALLIVAPLSENLLVAGAIELMLAYRCRVSTIVITIATCSAVLHGITGGWRACGGLIMFATMSYSYLHWYERPFSKRYLMTVAQHALFNLPGALLTVAH